MNKQNMNLVEIPVIITKNITILPGMLSHIDVDDEMSFQAFKYAMAGNKRVFVTSVKNIDKSEPDIEDLYVTGTVAAIKQAVKSGEKTYRVMVEGEKRAKIYANSDIGGFPFMNIIVNMEDDEYSQLINEQPQFAAQLQVIREKFVMWASINTKIPKDFATKISESENLFEDIWKIVGILQIRYDIKQELYELNDIDELLTRICVIIENSISEAVIANDFRNKVKSKVEKNQREYVLREQQKVIREELGEDTGDADYEDIKKKINDLKASDEIKNCLQKELKKYKRMSNQSSEANVIFTYIETLLEIPWMVSSQDNSDMSNAENILTNSHYGLEKVKERILEFLAVRIFTEGKCKSPIICLVGPPGTGKTSIAKSIAESIGKKYVRICLGGVSDEAEIRGHRRTYIGSKPGRIIDALTKAKVNNPLMLFDEIDKLGKDYKGDPSSALLEVLDSEQNNKFIDRYVEQPVDLSGVLFLATANNISGIPKPLRDRMEIIEINSYTQNEKLHIANEYLVKKQKKENGLERKQLSINDKALAQIIENYTREAGVRELERMIGKICRKATMLILKNEAVSVSVNSRNLVEFLGNPKYKNEKKTRKGQIGIVRGLAWTSVGGDTLEIEVNMMQGTGKLNLTGKLGDVMKESAEIAMTYVRSISKKYGVEYSTFKNNDFHLHVPEGAVPKDGPSAGVTMATAIFSTVTKQKVDPDVAMTGEITLRGKVLPIGGLKEKILAAKIFGIKKILVPIDNKTDVEEISDEIKEGLEIVFVSDMEQVICNSIMFRQQIQK